MKFYTAKTGATRNKHLQQPLLWCRLVLWCLSPRIQTIVRREHWCTSVTFVWIRNYTSYQPNLDTAHAPSLITFQNISEDPPFPSKIIYFLKTPILIYWFDGFPFSAKIKKEMCIVTFVTMCFEFPVRFPWMGMLRVGCCYPTGWNATGRGML